MAESYALVLKLTVSKVRGLLLQCRPIPYLWNKYILYYYSVLS